MVYILFLLSGTVVINEVMSNPLGSSGAGEPEDRNEFVELYNGCDYPVSISEWIVSDFDTEDELLPFYDMNPDSNVLIPPQGYAVIFDPEYIEEGNNYMPYGEPDCVILRPENTTIGDGLTNNDSIVLIDSSGDTVSTYFHPFNAGNGFSVERVSPCCGDIEENWMKCIDTSGTTCGYVNSVYSPPDFTLDSAYILDNKISAVISNITDTILSGDITIFNDINKNRVMDSGELLEEIISVRIHPDSSFSISIPMRDGVYFTGFKFIQTVHFRRFRIGEGVADLVLNEFMYKPDNCPEWMEFHNHSEFPISLDSIYINSELINKSIEISQGGYLVVAEDSSDFFAYYGNINAPLLCIPLSLSNEGDSIVVRDAHGFVFDYISYKGDASERNFTLEKVNPELLSNIPSNWASSLEEGGTPGMKNSIYTDYSSENISISLSPEHFTPDGDGKNESCIVSFDLPYIRNNVTIRIYDRKGHMVRSHTGVYGDSGGQWIWMGKNSGGSNVGTGLYIVFFMVENMDNQEKLIKKKVLSIGN